MTLPPHHAGSKICESENVIELAQMDRDHAPGSSTPSDCAHANTTNENNMSENIRRVMQESRRSSDDNIGSFVRPENSEIVVEESLQLHELQTYVREDHTTLVLTLDDSGDASTLGAGTLNCSSITDTSGSWTESTDLETSSFLSVISHGDSLTETASPPQNQEMNPQTSESSLPLQYLGPSTSSFSVDAPPATNPVSAASRAMDHPQVVDAPPPTQLLDPRAAGALYAGKLSPLMYIPPPPYTAQPPSYNAIGHTRSLATVSELQRSAPLTLEMPPSYDSAVDGDRPCVMRDLRTHRSEDVNVWTSGTGRRCSFSCTAWYLAFMIVMLLVYIFFRNT